MSRSGTRVILAVVAMFGTAACGGPDFDALCNDQEDCLGGNEADVDACIASYEGSSTMASDLGCTDEWDAYYECFIEHASCTTQSAGGNCTTTADCQQGYYDGAVECIGGQCQYKRYTLADSASDVCDAEANAWDNCGGW